MNWNEQVARLGVVRYLPSIYVLLAIIAVCLFANNQSFVIEAQIERTKVRRQLEILGAQIEGSLNAPIQTARGVIAALSSEPEMQQDRFDRLVSQVVDPSSDIRNFAAARDLVVNLVYPMAGNEQALGLDYHANDAQRDAVYRVRDSGEFILTGPVDLVQGGQGFIGRFPVYYTDTNEIQRFWGIFSVIIDLPMLYTRSGLLEPDLGLAVGLVEFSMSDGSQTQFLGPKDLLGDNPISVPVLFSNGSWELYGRPVDGWGSTVSMLYPRSIMGLVGLIVMMLATLTNHLSIQRKNTIQTLLLREEELETARQEVETLSLHDHLTGLPNRRFLDKTLGQLGKDTVVGLILLDLDDFKTINDQKGHLIGDKLLVGVSQRLRNALGENNFLARRGGDEFVVICMSSPTDKSLRSESQYQLEKLAQNLIEVVQPPFFTEGIKCRVGMSAGIHHIKGDEELPPDEWLIQADNAMYSAKQSGRNRYVFSSSLVSPSITEKYSGDDLLEALRNKQIIPYYQPIFEADGESIVGLEALARWQFPDGSISSSADFVGLANSMKVDGDLDQCILEHVAADIARWDRDGVDIPPISINISFRRLNDPQLCELIERTGIDPKRVAFELLESIFFDDTNNFLTDNVAALKRRGFRIDIDDFGSGHSSAISLLKLQPDCLKIDHKLVQAAVMSSQNKRLLASIVQIGSALDIEVCAEGIETTTQLEVARLVGCTKLQGFLLSRPMCRDKLTIALSGRAAFKAKANDRLGPTARPCKVH